MKLFAVLFLIIQGCASFTVPSAQSRRIAFVTRPFYVTTELKSDGQDVSDSSSEDEKRVLRERHTVFLGNLPFDLNDGEIMDLCKQYGKVLLVTVPKNRVTGQPRGFAFVDMGSSEELEAVVRGLDGTLVKGRNVRASVSDPSQKQEKQEKPEKRERQERKPVEETTGGAKIYVGNLPFVTTKEGLLEFYKQFCDPLDAYLPVNEATGAGRGFAFVTLKEEDVDAVIEKTNGYEFEGRPLVVNKPLPPGQRSTRRPSIRERTKLYVGNLAFSTDVGILEEVFGEFGEVLDCYMPEDPAKGGSRGFGFVTMARENAMMAIAELNGCELDGRFIRVNEAMPKGKMDDYDD